MTWVPVTSAAPRLTVAVRTVRLDDFGSQVDGSGQGRRHGQASQDWFICALVREDSR